MRFRDLFRGAVAMWIVVGLLGGPSLLLVAAAAFTATGPFAPHSTVTTDAQFSPGEAITVRGKDGVGIRPGDFVILAAPATVDPAAVTCEWKSRVYSTGEQRSGTVEPVAAEDLEAVVTDSRSGVEYRPVMTTARGTGWMEVDHLTCRGEGVETFAVTESGGLSASDRSTAGVVAAVFGIVMIVTGFIALHLTRRHGRQRTVPPQLASGPPGPYGTGPGAYPRNGRR